MEKHLQYDIQVDFYKKSGKWGYGGVVTVHHYDFDDQFKQDIVDNQSIIRDGWQSDDYIVVTGNINDDDPFAKRVYPAGSFWGIQKGGGKR